MLYEDIIKNIDKNDIKLSQIDNKVIFVPESMPINDVLKSNEKTTTANGYCCW